MSNQDFPFGHNYLGPFVGPDFSDNEFFGDMPNVEPLNSLLFHNVFGHAGRSVIHSAIQSHPGLGRGRMPVLTPFLARPLIDMREELHINPPFFDHQQSHPYQARLTNHGRIRAQVPIPPARAAPPQPAPQPAMSGRNRKRRASEKAISELKHMRLIDIKEDDDCCIICMEAFVDIKSSTDEPKRENALQMPCGHVFGSHCLKLWLKDHSTCPTCRKEVDFVEEDERNERGVAEMNRRRNAIDREMTTMRRTAERMARRQEHMQQHPRDEAAMQHQVLEVELIVQRQRFAGPRMDPAAREHGAEDAGWMTAGPHAPPQQLPSHYSQYLGIGIFPESSGHVVEEPMNNRHDPAARVPRAPPVQQVLPRPGMLLNYNHHPGVINRAGPPQEVFSPGGMPGFSHRHQQSSTMPQRSQSQRQSQRQSQYFQPYPEVNIAGRTPVPPNTGMIDQEIYTPDLGDVANDPTAFSLPEYIPSNLSNMHDNPLGAPSHHQNQSHYLYGWDSNRRVQHHQHQQYQHQHQQLQQVFTDPSPLPPQVPVNQLPDASRPACADRHQPAAVPPLNDQCDLADMSMCQHTFPGSNFNAVLPPGMNQIVNLNCGHGFHRACLMSAMKARAPRNVSQGRWMCAKCGRYEVERGAMEGRQQPMGHTQTVG